MDSIRRLGALVMSVLVLQLSLAAGLSACAGPAVIADATHAGMSMPEESDSCGDAAGTDCTPAQHGDCEAVMSCTAAMLQPGTQSQLATATHRARPTYAPRPLQTRSTVPDLPPPRA